jgi:golgi-specific brefeldin A-resistance guanine nucleotide exchange factor 1
MSQMDEPPSLLPRRSSLSGKHTANPGDVETKSVLCVKAEIHNVLTSLRHGSDKRWSSKERFEHEIPLKEEHTLLRAFKELHFYLEEFDDLRDVDTVEYLKPFLQVITSQHTNAAITMVALRSLNKFLLYDFISASSPRAIFAINDMAHALARCCRFNERVLMQLMQVSELAVRNPAGRLLTDDHICELFKVCFRICRSVDASMLLRQSAESTLSHIIITVFGRVTESAAKEPASSPALLAASPPPEVEEELLSSTVLHQNLKPETLAKATPPADAEPDASSAPPTTMAPVDQTSPSAYRTGSLSDSVFPYGPSCLFRLLRFIGSLINPGTQEEDVRVLGLSLLNTVLETGGEMLGSIPEVVDLIQSEICKYLLQDSQTEELPVLALVLRVIFNLFNSIKSHLKVQLEVFFTSVHLGICESRSELVTSEQKEIALESLLEFCREPALMVDLYKNYDCDVQCTNLFETLCGCLCRNAVPVGGRTGRLTILHTLSLESILAVLDSIARRCNVLADEGVEEEEGEDGDDHDHSSDLNKSFTAGGDAQIQEGVPSPSRGSAGGRKRTASRSTADSFSMPNTPEWKHRHSSVGGGEDGLEEDESLQQQKKRKILMKRAAEKFNTDSKGWMKFALEAGLVSPRVVAEDDGLGQITVKTAASPGSVAKFLLHTPGLDKSMVGDYLSEPTDKSGYSGFVLREYTSLFNFSGMSFVEGMRVFLESFRLPGEAQKIDRLMECWARHWFDANPDAVTKIQDADVAYVLAFSIIMLNTDLHNDQVKDKMTIEQYMKNNRGINGGKDIDRSFQEAIYAEILGKQIRIKHDPAGGNVGNDEAVQQAAATWDSVVRRQESVADAAFTPSVGRKAQLTMQAGALEREMFCMISDSALDAIDIVYDMTVDSSLALKAIEGFHNYAKITAYYNLSGAFNHMMILLNRRFSSFVSNGHLWVGIPLVARRRSSSLGGVSDELPSQLDSVQPGKDDARGTHLNRGLATLQTIVSLTRTYGNHVCEGWRNVVNSILHLHSENLLVSENVAFTSSMFVEEFDDPRLDEQLKAVQAHRRRQEDACANEDSGGLLSSFASWFGTVDEVAETEEEDIERRNQEGRVERLRNAIAPLALQKLFEESSVLPEKPFLEMLKALLLARDPTTSAGDSHPGQHASVQTRDNARAKFEEESMFCIDMLTIIALANSHRVKLVWEMLAAYFDRILRHTGIQSAMPRLIGRIAVCILKICHGLMYVSSDACSMLLHSLGLLTRMNLDGTLVDNGISLSYIVGKNSCLILQRNHAHFSQETWNIFIAHLRHLSGLVGAREPVLDAVDFLIQCNSQLIGIQNIDFLMPLLVAYLQNVPASNAATNAVAVGTDANGQAIRALSLMFHLSRHAAFLGNPGEVELWAKVLAVVGQYFYDSRKSVSAAAQDTLQRSLLDPPTPTPSQESWYHCFDAVLLPLVDFSERDNLARLKGTDTHLRAVAMFARTFLYNKRYLIEMDNFHTLWLKVISALAKPFGGARAQEGMTSLQFTARESLKNLLLVSRADGMFEAVSQRTNQDVLGLTWALVDSMAPGLRVEIEESFSKAPGSKDVPSATAITSEEASSCVEPN